MRLRHRSAATSATSCRGSRMSWCTWNLTNAPGRDSSPKPVLSKRVARRQRSALQAALEPLDALRGRSVREALGRDATAAHPLDAVVANRGCGVEAGFQIAL